MAKDWRAWLVWLPPDKVNAVQQLCKTAEKEPACQKDFILWLGEQPEFQESKLALALFQLAQCREFKKWSTLEPYQRMPEDFKKLGVYGICLREGQEGNAENVKQIVAVIIPRSSAKEHQLKVFPINFNAKADTQMAMEQAGKAALQFLGWRGLALLITYLFAGDFIFLSFLRFVKILWYTRHLHRTVKGCTIYLLIDSPTGSEVAGPSLGLATCLAILMGLGKLPAGTVSPRSAKFLTRFIPRFLSRLSEFAFTGEVQNGTVEPVDGISEKIKAMDQHPAIRRGVLPRENRKDGISANSVSLFWCKSVSQALRWLIPLRKTWGIINLFFLLIVALGISFGPRLHDLYVSPQPYFMGIESKIRQDFVEAKDAMKYGCKVRQLDRIILYIGGNRDDGHTSVKIGAQRVEALRSECLKTQEEPEDWHPELTLPVNQGRVIFDYQHSQANHDDSATLPNDRALTVAIIRHGKGVKEFSITLIIR